MAKDSTKTAGSASAPERETTIIGSIGPKNLGNTRGVEDLDGKRELYLGRIIGIASGIKTGETEREGKKNKYVGLTGSFRGIPADPARPIVTSGVCYLPPGVAEQMTVLFYDEDGQPLDDVQVKFAFDIFTVFAANPSGHSFKTKAVVDVGAADPVADFAAELPPPPNAQLRLASNNGDPA